MRGPVKLASVSVLVLAALKVISDAALGSDMSVRHSRLSKFHVLYLPIVGDYRRGWERYYYHMIDLVRRRIGNDVTNAPYFGIYYDDPEKVPVEELRMVMGMIVPEGTKSDEFLMFKDDLLFDVINEMENVSYVACPEGSAITMITALWRCYPALREHMETHYENQTLTPVMELYGYKDGEVLFIQAPLAPYLGPMSSPPFMRR